MGTATAGAKYWAQGLCPLKPAEDGASPAWRPDLALRDLRQALIPAAIDLDIKIADLFAQRVAVDPQQVGGADLVAARGCERRRQQRIFDLPQDAVIEAGRRQAVIETGEICREMPLDRAAQRFLRARLVAADRLAEPAVRR